MKITLPFNSPEARIPGITLPLLLLLALIGLWPARVASQVPSFIKPAFYFDDNSNPAFDASVADFDGDGSLDILTVNAKSGSLKMLVNKGDGTFNLKSIPSPGNGTFSSYYVESADVNSDGKVDALVIIGGTANSPSDKLGVLSGDGKGGLTLQNNLIDLDRLAGLRAMKVADINGDNKPDVLLTDNSGMMEVLPGDGAGGFTSPARYFSTGTSNNTTGLEVSDVNGDGKPDVLTAHLDTRTLTVMLGDGNGNFTLQPNPVSIGEGNTFIDLATGDVNSDGKPDLLVANSQLNTLSIFLGDGKGAFIRQNNSPATGTSNNIDPIGFNRLAVADINGDGKLDALVNNYSPGELSILPGDGRGGFSLSATTYMDNIYGPATSITVADVSHDGRPDVITTNYASVVISPLVAVLLNTTTALPTRAALPGTSATLYPNPARSSATLTLAGLPATATQAQATLLDAVGRVVGRHTLAATGGSLPLAGLRPGLYVVQLAALDAQGQVLGALPMQRLAVD